MRKLFAGCRSPRSRWLSARPPSQRPKPMKGELVDLTCYNKEQEHRGGEQGLRGGLRQERQAGRAGHRGRQGLPMIGGLAADKNAKLIAHMSAILSRSQAM